MVKTSVERRFAPQKALGTVDASSELLKRIFIGRNLEGNIV